MRAYMLVRGSIIAQPIESQGNKNLFSTIMQANYAGFARQSSTSLRARRLPGPGTLGSLRLGPTVRDRLARLAGESAVIDCNQLSTSLMARLTWDCAHGT